MSGLYYNLALRNSDLRDKDSEKLYYCVLKNRGVLDQDTFVNYLSQITGIKEAICLGVLSKLGAAVINYLKDGQSVDIPHLGTFNLTASSTGVKTLDEAKASQIKAINLRFSAKEETDLVLSRCALTRSVSLTNTNDVIKEKDQAVKSWMILLHSSIKYLFITLDKPLETAAFFITNRLSLKNLSKRPPYRDLSLGGGRFKS